MHKSKAFTLTALVCILLFGVPLHTVFACSGGPPAWEMWLPQLVEQSDVIVVGSYVELDEVEANGILRVTSYLEGQGSEYLVIRSNDIRHVENQRNVYRRFPACLQVRQLYTTGTYLYFLSRQADGTYTIHHSQYFGDVNATDMETAAFVESGLAELTAQISAEVEYGPNMPNVDSVYPRTTPILLTTTGVDHFLLPVDTTEIVSVANSELVDLRRDQHECSAPPCTVYSPNGLNKVNLVADRHEQSALQQSLFYIESNAVGDRIAFSPTSDTYVLWRDEMLELYALWYPDLGYPDNRFSSIVFTAEFVTAVPAGDSVDYPVAWSPDGRMLAFSTENGLWLWDALTVDHPPQLLLPTTNVVPTVRYFSPQGRYLAITDGDRHYNYDLVTHQELPDGYVSPDDRILLIFDTDAESPTTLEVAYLAPGIRRSEFNPEVHYLDVMWVDNAYFLASITGLSFMRLEVTTMESASGEISYEAIPYVVEEPFVDVVTYHSSGLHSIERLDVPYLLRREIQMRDFTYETGPGLIEISEDGFHLDINGDFLSFESILAEPVEDAIWLPSAFYYAPN